MPQPSARVGYLLCVIAAVAWSATSPGLSYLITAHGANPIVIAFWRDALIALVCLLGVGGASLLRGRPLPRLSGAEWRGFALTGALSIGIYHALFVSSIALNGAALGIVLIYLYPAFVTLGARVIFHETIGPRQVIALLLALLGSVLLVRAYDPAVLRVSWLGVLVGLASAIAHAGYVLFSQRAIIRHSPWLTLALTMGFGTLSLLALGLISLGPAAMLQVGSGLEPWLIMAGIALGPTLVGYALFTMSMRHIPGRIASLVVVIEAPIATAAAVLLLGERIDLLQGLGMALILSAAVLPGLPLPARRRLRPAGEP